MEPAETAARTHADAALPHVISNDYMVEHWLACYAVLARHWIDTRPAQTTRERMVLLFAWNEIGEGGSIIPNHRDGYAYADVVRTVFGGPEQAPTAPSYCHGAGA